MFEKLQMCLTVCDFVEVANNSLAQCSDLTSSPEKVCKNKAFPRPRGGRIDTTVSPMHALADILSSGAGDVPGKLLGTAAKRMLKTEAKARMGRFLDGLFGGDNEGSSYTAPVASNKITYSSLFLPFQCLFCNRQCLDNRVSNH